MYALKEFDPAVPLIERTEAVVSAPDIVGVVGDETKKLVYELVLKYAFDYTGATNARELRDVAWILKTIHQFVQKANTDAAIKAHQQNRGITNAESANILLRLDRVVEQACSQYKTGAPLFRNLEKKSPTQSPGYATSMLLDLPTTASIVGQIAFEQPASPNTAKDAGDMREWGMVVDLGSGSGILGLAGAINCVRRKCNVTLLGFEQNPYDVERSSQVLDTLTGEIAGHSLHHRIENADITQDAPYEEIRKTDADFPLQVWISETFGGITPTLTIGTESVSWPTPKLTFNDPRSHKRTDPLPLVLRQQLKYDADFFRKTQNGEIVMFPNVTNDSTLFGQAEKNALRLSVYGPEKRLLIRIGSEFRNFENLGASCRW